MCSAALEAKSFENVNGRTNDRRKVITIAHPEQSSGELKSWHVYITNGPYWKIKSAPMTLNAIAPDKAFFSSSKKYWYFSYCFSMKTYVVGIH